MITVLKNAIRWLQSLLPAWIQSNSWVSEGISGAALVLVPMIWLSAGLAWVVALGFSVFYEAVLDPWGWNLDDVLQRLVASTAVVLVAVL